MFRLTPILLLTVLALIPMGNGVVTLCGLLSLLGSEVHHHEDSLGNSLCLEDEGHAHHNEEKPAPCSDDCMLDPPAASLFKVQQHKHLPLSSILPIRAMVDRQIPLGANALRFSKGQATYPTQANDSSPPFTGRFLL